MSHFAKIIISLFLCALLFNASAQNNTISPYSRFGIGLYEQNGFGRNLAMGGVGIAMKSSKNVNNINPSSYASLDSTMVLFDIGMHLDYEYLETHIETGGKLNGNISYFSLSVAPNDKFGISFGIAPYTSIGYTVESSEYIAGGGLAKYVSHVEGIGGLTRIYLGTGVNITKTTSVGMNGSILFGQKSEQQRIYSPYVQTSSIFIENTDYYVGGKLDFGVQQQIPLSKENSITIGGIISTPGIMRCAHTDLAVSTFIINGLADTLYFEDDDQDRYTQLPMTWGVGASFNMGNRFTVAADYNANPLSKLDVKDRRSNLLDNHTISVGAEYVPRRLGSKYDLVFRGGFNFASGTYEIDDYILKSFSVTGGVGFRIKSVRFNTFASYNHRGTLDNLLILDQSIRMGVNITYIDYWFQKRRFN